MHTGLSEWSARLAVLAEFEPPRDGWEAIQAARRLRAAGESRRWPIAIAATVLTAVAGLAWQLQSTQREPMSGISLAAAPAIVAGDAVRVENAWLERLLASLPEMRVIRGSTAFTVSQLEDRLAFVDDRLSRITLEPNAPEHAERLWRERVELMNSLVQVRYADVASPL
ncbi:MAG: hypothetical protein EXR87_00855 [Gammaproteobacteria bacterium]|nr:hypothetical protein [Gammaproteobacteria bacterium]